jgi:hypothetical protein
MRINRDILLKIAKDTVEEATRSEMDILSVYLAGSLLEQEFLLGGAADIDLVFIWNGTPPLAREIRALSDQVHLDIKHTSRTHYRQTRQLRVHPWLGPEIARAQVLYDPQHFMDFTQASVRGQFDNPEYVLARAGVQAESARAIWSHLYQQEGGAQDQSIPLYLKVVEKAANAIASLSGPPLTERRFLLNYPNRAESVGKPGLYAGVLGLLGWINIDVGTMNSWLPDWRQAWSVAQAIDGDVAWCLARHVYYEAGIRGLVESDHPEAALWPMIFTWMRACEVVQDRQVISGFWRAADQLGLDDIASARHIQALDAYLDLVEETLETWGEAQGVV